MRTIADKLGIGPQRRSDRGADGIWTVTVTPPGWSGFTASTVRLPPDQHARYLAWLAGDGLIQELLPELTDADREILMTGIDEAQWQAAFGDEE
jgi:hypothetical protein